MTKNRLCAESFDLNILLKQASYFLNKIISFCLTEDLLHKAQKITRVKCEYKKPRSVQIVTVGSRVFVTSFQLAGVQGIIVESPEKALVEITRLMNDSSIGLVLVSDDVSKSISVKLTELRSKKSTPLVFELPAPGSQKGEVDYRLLLKQILGV